MLNVAMNTHIPVFVGHIFASVRYIPMCGIARSYLTLYLTSCRMAFQSGCTEKKHSMPKEEPVQKHRREAMVAGVALVSQIRWRNG
jgi:hypothetical protein